MTEVERAEEIAKRYLGLGPPWDRALARKTFEYVLERVWDIVAFMSLGSGMIKDPVRRKFIMETVGPNAGVVDPDEYGFNLWLANEVTGDPPPPGHVLLRCKACRKLRVHRNWSWRSCKCGGVGLNAAVPDESSGVDHTRVVMKALVMGR